MTFTQVQVFAIAVIVGGLFGAYRGWRREVITLAIELATVAFLLLHGVETIASLSSGASTSLIPMASAQGLSGGTGNSSTNAGNGTFTPLPTVVCTNPVNLEMVELLIFFVMTFLAYRLGWAWGGRPKDGNERIIGFFVGAVNGAVIMFYLSKTVLKGETITLFSPSGFQAGQYLPLVIAGAFILVVLLLLIGTQARSRQQSAGGAAH